MIAMVFISLADMLAGCRHFLRKPGEVVGKVSLMGLNNYLDYSRKRGESEGISGYLDIYP